MEVYYSSIEYHYEEGSINYGKYEGGFVYAFVQAHDARDALKKIELELEPLCLRIEKVWFVAIYEDIPWESQDEQKKYDGLAEKASQTQDVICDDFYAFVEDGD